MAYKQVIIVNKELGMSSGKLASQVSHSSMAFLTKMIQCNTEKQIENYYGAVDVSPIGAQTARMYKRADLMSWSMEAFERGEDCFYARPVNPNDPYGELELCEPNYHYECHMTIDKDLYDQWICGSFTKVILEAKNEAQMQKIVEKAKAAGMIEGVDFYLIRDNCLTELTPDETGTRWTCIGFAPMDAEKIDIVTKKLQLYKW